MKIAYFHRFLTVALLACGAACLDGQTNGQSAPQTACPWLTQGMAARILGGEVSLDLHVSDAGEGACSFVRIADPDTSLRIEVSKAALPACGADATQLRGIGNEALRCALPAPAGRAIEKIASRVRDRYFTLTRNSPAADASRNSDEKADDGLEQAAESVAGNLY